MNDSFLNFDYKWIMFGIWVLIIIITFIIEITTNGIWSGLTSIAALPSMIISASLKSTWWSIVIQILVFLILWTILYFSLYKILKNKFSKTKWVGPIQDLKDEKPTELLNDSYEYGSSEQIYGKIILQGKEYRTISNTGQGKILKGEKVKVVDIKGNVLYIKRA